MTTTETSRRHRRPRCTRAAVIGTILLIIAASCGGDDDITEPAASDLATPTTSAAAEERVPDIDTPPTSAPTSEASDASTATIAELAGLVDLAVVGHGASLVEVSTEWDQSTWSAVNLIDGRADRGWASSEPGGAFVIGLAHPTIQSISIDTTEAEEQTYPGISAAQVEIERATDLSTFPDLDWEPVGVIELEPQTIGTLETPDLLAPMLRFRVENGGNPTWVEIMEVSAWGELTEASSTLDMLEILDVAASERPNTVLFGDEWAFDTDLDGTVLACSTDGTRVDLEPLNGALVGTLTAADGSRGELLVSGSAATVTVIVDADGDPQVAWGVLKPGPVSCERERTGTTTPDLVEIDASGDRRADPPLTVAAYDEDLDEVVRLLDAGEDPNVAEERKGWTPLLFAAQAGDPEIVRALLDAGADIDRGSDDGWTPLMIASQNGHDDTVDLLLDAGANVLGARADNWTAL
ncbi:MAG: ankyrin repeat domain-containing protein, partial [Acidimicrobiia bacterium]